MCASTDVAHSRAMTLITRQTDRLTRVFGFARRESVALEHTEIGTEHLLLGLLREEQARAGSAGPLTTVGLDNTVPWHEIVRVAEAQSGRASSGDGDSESLPLSARAETALEHAHAVSDEMVDYTIGVRHMLLGLLADQDCGAARTLFALNVDLGELRASAREGVDEDTSARSSAGIGPVVQQLDVVLQALGRLGTRLDAIEARLGVDTGSE